MSVALIAVAASLAGPQTFGEADRHEPGHGGPRDAAIVNGEVEDEFPATVGLGAFNFTGCTGSLVTPRMVLTAAHCGAEVPLELVVELGNAYFGTTPATSFETIRFGNLWVHPEYEPLVSGYGGSLGKNDVAVLELQWEAETEPIVFNTERLNRDVVGTELVSVGFGVTESEDDPPGTKRSAVLTVSDLDKTFLYSRSSDNANQANICSGDSGGPQYFWDEEHERYVQWAVHSWGDENCAVESGSTRTDTVADWLLDRVEEVHGTSDFCEINGQYDDGTCDTWCAEVDPDCVEPEVAEDEARACGCGTTPSWPTGWVVLAALGGGLVRSRSRRR